MGQSETESILHKTQNNIKKHIMESKADYIFQKNNEIKTLQKKYDDLKARIEAMEKGTAENPTNENTEKKAM